MTSRQGRPFFPIENSAAPSFNSTALSTAAVYALEATGREWQGPSNRAVRVASVNSTEPFFVKFGPSTVVASTTNSLLIPGAWPSVFYVTPSQTHISICSAVLITANVTVGYAG